MKTTKLIATTVAAVAVSGGAAAAATGTLPSQSDAGRSIAEEHTGFEVPTSQDDHPTADDHPGGPPTETQAPADEVIEVEVPDEDAPADNHGATVSAVAQGETSGNEHGEAVSAVASGNGAAHRADSPTPEQPAQAATPGTVPDAASDQGAEGAAHAEGHGRP
jgi:hypothetical protein